MKPIACVALLFAACAVVAQAPPPAGNVVSRNVQIKEGGLRIDCPLLFDANEKKPRPGVIVAVADPESQPVRARAVRLANAGYVVMATDLAGPSAVALNVPIANKRLKLAIDVFEKQPQVVAHKLALIGYGDHGKYVLEYARSGEGIAGVACVHGNLTSHINAPPKISGRVLALVGSDDPLTSLTKLDAFEKEMKSGTVDWDMIRYGGVGADFTNPKSKSYDADADARAHAALKQFLDELFPPPAARSFAAPRPAAKAAVTAGVPDKALKVLLYVDDHDRAPDGYEGGRHFGNFEKKLPANDRSGRRIRYREWDVNPLKPGVNRGPERLVTGSDGGAHYTPDHYETFKKIR